MEQHNEQLLLSEIRNLSAAIEKLYKRQSIWFNFMSGVDTLCGLLCGNSTTSRGCGLFFAKCTADPNHWELAGRSI